MSDVLTHRAFDLGARYRVHHWSLVVSLQCLQCEPKPILRVIDGRETTCPSCGATYQIGGLRWDVTAPQNTVIAIAASSRIAEPTVTPQ